MIQRTSPLEQPTPPRPPVTVKGARDGLRITVSSADPGAVEASLREHLERRSGAFFEGASVRLEMPAGRLDLPLVARLSEVIEAAGMSLHQITRRDDGQARPEPALEASPTHDVASDAALVIGRTLRSGQRIVHDGPVLILGDVNPGAEVVAGGSVVVWGHLRGTVEAGLNDDGGALVCALDLSPTQLRIGPALARAPEEPGRTPVPEVAREVDGRIVVDVWTAV